MASRRDLLGALGATALAGPALAAARGKRLLILGGTSFLGPAIVEHALARGHTLTLFNRGRTNPDLFPGVEKLRGDRDPKRPDLSALAGRRTWDAVIDVWPSDPAMAEATGRMLRDRVGRCVYVSSIVAYKDLVKVGAVETDPLFDDASDKAAWYEFGKASSERSLTALFAERYSSVRSHIIGGWRQESDTLRFWMERIARGGPVLAPGDGSDPVQFTDVKDVAAFTVALAEQGLAGAWNVAGPAREPQTMRSVLEAFNAASGGRAELTWVADDFLLKQNVQAWTDLPLYRPLKRAVRKGFMQVDQGKALAAGLQLRPLSDLMADELAWLHRSKPQGYDFGVNGSDKGIPRARELAVLAAWKAASGPKPHSNPGTGAFQ